MSKIDLKTKIEGLKKAIAEHKDFAGTYESNLAKAEQELKDIEKEMKKHKKMQKQLNAKGMTLDDVLRQMKKNRK